MWSRIRSIVYAAAVAAVGLAAYALSYAGLATYDPASGMIDIAPFNLRDLVGLMGTWATSAGLAFVAIVRGWGVRE